MGILTFKSGVTLASVPDPGGARLLGSIERIARAQPDGLMITSAGDSHPLADPHTLGRAFDVRTHPLTDEQKADVLHDVLADLGDGPVLVNPAPGFNTQSFFGWLEHEGEPDEHLHFQVRHGVTWPPDAGVRNA